MVSPLCSPAQQLQLRRGGGGGAPSTWGPAPAASCMLWGAILARVALPHHPDPCRTPPHRHTIAFVLLMSAIDMVFSLPWSIISTFYVEQKHGFNKQTPLLFVGAAGEGRRRLQASGAAVPTPPCRAPSTTSAPAWQQGRAASSRLPTSSPIAPTAGPQST